VIFASGGWVAGWLEGQGGGVVSPYSAPGDADAAALAEARALPLAAEAALLPSATAEADELALCSVDGSLDAVGGAGREVVKIQPSGEVASRPTTKGETARSGTIQRRFMSRRVERPPPSVQPPRTLLSCLGSPLVCPWNRSLDACRWDPGATEEASKPWLHD